MEPDLLVLQTLVRLSRSGAAKTAATIAAQLTPAGSALKGLGADLGEVRASLGRLARAGLITRSAHGAVRLTLAGLAVGVATQAAQTAAKRAPSRRQSIPAPPPSGVARAPRKRAA